MKNIIQKIENFMTLVGAWWARPQNKKRCYIMIALVVVLWFVYRFAMVAIENNRFVFNMARVAQSDGTPVLVLEMKKTDGEIQNPVFVKNNRAYVTGEHAKKLRPGQKIDGGTVVGVSSGIDYDTGMYLITTRNVEDGLQYVKVRATCYFVPLDALHNKSVFVADNGVAKSRGVQISYRDAQYACVTDGLDDGDVLILSNVADGEKIQIQK